jgi:hypothetical protein
MGYHNKKIKKGVYGEFSKIQEEFEELQDAIEQNNPIMELCECSDLIGAIEAYCKKYNINLYQIINMTRRTQSAFQEGERK